MISRRKTLSAGRTMSNYSQFYKEYLFFIMENECTVSASGRFIPHKYSHTHTHTQPSMRPYHLPPMCFFVVVLFYLSLPFLTYKNSNRSLKSVHCISISSRRLRALTQNIYEKLYGHNIFLPRLLLLVLLLVFNCKYVYLLCMVYLLRIFS